MMHQIGNNEYATRARGIGVRRSISQGFASFRKGLLGQSGIPVGVLFWWLIASIWWIPPLYPLLIPIVLAAIITGRGLPAASRSILAVSFLIATVALNPLWAMVEWLESVDVRVLLMGPTVCFVVYIAAMIHLSIVGDVAAEQRGEREFYWMAAARKFMPRGEGGQWHAHFAAAENPTERTRIAKSATWHALKLRGADAIGSLLGERGVGWGLLAWVALVIVGWSPLWFQVTAPVVVIAVLFGLIVSSEASLSRRAAIGACFALATGAYYYMIVAWRIGFDYADAGKEIPYVWDYIGTALLIWLGLGAAGFGITMVSALRGMRKARSGAGGSE